MTDDDPGTGHDEARATADRWAAVAQVQIVDLHAHRDMEAVSRLVDEVWGREPGAGAILVPEILTAVAHAGGQVSGAYREGRLVAATAAFLGRTPDGQVFLHSHVTGVADTEVSRGVGRALKWHQRAWCLDRGIARVRWTFDPLVRRNAVFNLVHLGAGIVAYEEDCYGPMQDARNAGLPTDRLLAEWDLTAARVIAAAGGRAAEPDTAALRRGGAGVALAVGKNERPVVTPTDAPRRLVQVPADIEALRAQDPGLGAAWSQAIRAALGGGLTEGLRVTGCTRDGWYVLARPGGVEVL